MYIGSTNYFLDMLKYNTQVPANWVTSERYENCENFHQYRAEKPNRSKLLRRKK